MKTFTVTDAEYAILRKAVEINNDIEEDTLFEDVDYMYPSSDEPIMLTAEKASKMRNEINEVLDRRDARMSLNRKLGIKTNDKGYSV